MDLKARINKDLIAALKSRDNLKTETLRFLLASIHNREIEKRSKADAADLTDEEIYDVLNREAKKRKEAAQIYEKGGRPELAEKELKELEIIKEYLPAELSEEEVRKIAAEAVAKTGAKNEKDFGKVMGEAMKQLKGKADSSVVSRIIKEFLVEK